MKNYICINGQQIELTEEQIKQIRAAQDQEKIKLADMKEGDTFKIGDHEFVVLEHREEGTALIRKELLREDEEFSGNNNNYAGSNVEKICNEFAVELAGIVGAENVVLHDVDLTSDDGLKDYGVVKRRVSLLTADMYRKFVDILDKHKPDAWWWLATAHSTERHGNSSWVRCVSPAGGCSNGYYYGLHGVRPFCILKSNIFVSK